MWTASTLPEVWFFSFFEIEKSETPAKAENSQSTKESSGEFPAGGLCGLKVLAFETFSVVATWSGRNFKQCLFRVFGKTVLANGQVGKMKALELK